jgi:hypothetical protein
MKSVLFGQKESYSVKYDSHSHQNHMKTVDSVSVIAHGGRSDVPEDAMSTGSHRQAEVAESAAMFARSV